MWKFFVFENILNFEYLLLQNLQNSFFIITVILIERTETKFNFKKEKDKTGLISEKVQRSAEKNFKGSCARV